MGYEASNRISVFADRGHVQGLFRILAVDDDQHIPVIHDAVYTVILVVRKYGVHGIAGFHDLIGAGNAALAVDQLHMAIVRENDMQLSAEASRTASTSACSISVSSKYAAGKLQPVSARLSSWIAERSASAFGKTDFSVLLLLLLLPALPAVPVGVLSVLVLPQPVIRPAIMATTVTMAMTVRTVRKNFFMLLLPFCKSSNCRTGLCPQAGAAVIPS